MFLYIQINFSGRKCLKSLNCHSINKQNSIWSCWVMPKNLSFNVCQSLGEVEDFFQAFQINQPTRWTISQVYYLMSMCGSTCFGHSHAHHQELDNCGSSLWFYCWSVVVAVLLVVVGPVITNEMQLCRIIYCSLTSLHVSSNTFAHHQEHLNCNYSFWVYSRVSLSAAVMDE